MEYLFPLNRIIYDKELYESSGHYTRSVGFRLKVTGKDSVPANLYKLYVASRYVRIATRPILTRPLFPRKNVYRSILITTTYSCLVHFRMKAESLDLIDATADRIRLQMGQEMENLKTRTSTNEVRFGGWKCRYCPYTANTSKKLYSHYQFHQQLLTSQCK